MSAFIIINVVIKNPEKFSEYVEQSLATLAQFGAEPLAKGKFMGEVSGSGVSHQMAAMVKFPDLESIDKWYSSDAYQALVPLRDESADVTIIKYSAG